MIKRLNWLALTLLLSVTTISLAAKAPNYFKVELIIFQNINQPSLQSEIWPSTVKPPNLYNTILLSQPADASNTTQTSNPQSPQTPAPEATTPITTTASGPTPYQLLTADQFTLQSIANKISNKQNYQIILHQAWIQPGVGKRFAKKIHIYGGQLYNDSGEVIQAVNLPQDPSDALWQVNGTIQLIKNRFFSANTNLILTLPSSQLTAASFQQIDPTQTQTSLPDSLKSFQMYQSRRLKPNELNYFDHPLFGMLIKITPIKTDQSSKQSSN